MATQNVFITPDLRCLYQADLNTCVRIVKAQRPNDRRSDLLLLEFPELLIKRSSSHVIKLSPSSKPKKQTNMIFIVSFSSQNNSKWSWVVPLMQSQPRCCYIGVHFNACKSTVTNGGETKLIRITTALQVHTLKYIIIVSFFRCWKSISWHYIYYTGIKFIIYIIS